MKSLRKLFLPMAVMAAMSVSVCASAGQFDDRRAPNDFATNFDYVSIQYGETNIAEDMEMLAIDYSASITDYVFIAAGISSSQEKDNDRITYNRSEIAVGGKLDVDFVVPATAYIKGGVHYSELKNKDNDVYFFPSEDQMKDHGYLVDVGFKLKPLSDYAEFTVGYGVLRYNDSNTTNDFYYAGVDLFVGESFAFTIGYRNEEFGAADVPTSTVGFKLSL